MEQNELKATGEKRLLAFYKISALVIFFCVIFSSAWICDDAYHGFSMSRNLANGHGFVYNIGERVNASTMPLMSIFQAILFKITRSMFISGILSGIILSTLAVYFLIIFFCKNTFDVVFCLSLLLCSKSFVTFTTSGLENPLLFFSIALYFLVMKNIEENDYVCTSHNFFVLGLLCSLILLTRMDNILFVFPSLCYLFLTRRNTKEPLFKHVFFGMLGITPFIVWIIFSIIYYGFPFPNTAYAKLGTGIPLYEYILHGLSYFFSSFLESPITILWILASIVLLLKIGKKGMLYACGVLLYLFYILYIGGDFMNGRHFTVAFFYMIFVFLLFVKKNFGTFELQKITALLIICGLIPVSIPEQTRKMINAACNRFFLCNYAIDERDFYTSSSEASRFHFLTWCLLKNRHEGIDFLSDVPKQGENGCFEFCSGVDHYYNHGLGISGDIYGLGDAFVVRCPLSPELKNGWRTGHLHRDVPAEYDLSLKVGRNLLVNDIHHKLLDNIWLITRGPIWSKDRIKTIFYFNIKAPVCNDGR